MSEVKNIPYLRFSDYHDNWITFSIKNIAKVIRGASPRPKGDPRYYGGNVPRLMGSDVTRDGKYVTPKTDFLTNEGSKKSRFLPKGSLTMTCSGNVGIPSFLNIDACIHDGFLAFIDKSDKIEDDFFYYSLFVLKEKLERGATHGGVFTNLTTQIVKDYNLSIPSIPEQQKIADFLTAVDKRIELLEKKKTLLETYKKGVMKKIFNQEIRFKDDNGNDFPDWEEKRLDEISKFRRGSFPQPYGLPEWYDDINGIPFVQVYDVGENFKLKSQTKQKISSLAQPKSVFVPKESILITIQGSIGRVAITQYDSYVDRTLLIFTKLNENLNKYFFVYQLYRLFDIEKRRAPGGTIKTITKEKLSSFTILIPDVVEQLKISNFLFSIDKQLEILDAQIDKSKTWKKGLLQKMFV